MPYFCTCHSCKVQLFVIFCKLQRKTIVSKKTSPCLFQYIILFLSDPPESASNRYRPAMYLALVVAVSFCGMLLYLYRRNLAGTRRIFLDRTTNNAQSITLLPSGNVLSDGTMAFLPSGADSPPPPYDTVLMHQENGSSEGDNHQDDDPELPTYEEVVSTSPQVT